jgi:hypothetical protein
VVLSVVAVLIALTALAIARRATRKLEALNQSYWELRYDFTRLRSQVSRLDPGEADAEAAAPAPAPAQSVTFVPLSSIKKKNE